MRINKGGNIRQLVVPCTARVQRAMIRNLQEAARSKVNETRAQKAEDILDSLNHKPHTVSSLAEATTSTSKALDREMPVTTITQGANSKKGLWVKKVLHKCARGISGLAGRIRFRRT